MIESALYNIYTKIYFINKMEREGANNFADFWPNRAFFSVQGLKRQVRWFKYCDGRRDLGTTVEIEIAQLCNALPQR